MGEKPLRGHLTARQQQWVRSGQGSSSPLLCAPCVRLCLHHGSAGKAAGGLQSGGCPSNSTSEQTCPESRLWGCGFYVGGCLYYFGYCTVLLSFLSACRFLRCYFFFLLARFSEQDLTGCLRTAVTLLLVP